MQVKVEQQDERRERAQQAEPSVPHAVLRLQNELGNAAVARLLSDRRLQRTEIEIANFSQVATGAGRGNVPGSQIPHIAHGYDMPTGREKAMEHYVYDADAWLKAAVQERGKDVDGARDIRQGAGGLIKRERLDQIIRTWDGTVTIIEPILNAFILLRDQTPKWYAPGAEAGERVRVGVKSSIDLQDDDFRRLVMHLISLRVAAHWRTNTINMLSATDIPIDRDWAPKVDVKLDWNALLTASRLRARARLMDIDPDRPPPKVSERSALDEDVYNMLTEDTEASKLTDHGFIELMQDGSYKVFKARTVEAGGDVGLQRKAKCTISEKHQGDLKAALNHLRFLVYLEWRAVYELARNAKG